MFGFEVFRGVHTSGIRNTGTSGLREFGKRDSSSFEAFLFVYKGLDKFVMGGARVGNPENST